jgi:hypothetical protein
VTGFALGGFSVQFERTTLNEVKRAVSLGTLIGLARQVACKEDREPILIANNGLQCQIAA